VTCPPEAVKKLGSAIVGQLDIRGSKMIINKIKPWHGDFSLTDRIHYNAPVAQMDRAADF
jgi:hypothetical protein